MPRPPSSSGRQHGHVQSASMVAKSLAKDACRRFRVPVETMALPKRWGKFFPISCWVPILLRKYIQQFWWARRNRTCRPQGRWKRGGLPGSRRPSHSGVYSEGANLCRRSRWEGFPQSDSLHTLEKIEFIYTHVHLTVRNFVFPTG